MAVFDTTFLIDLMREVRKNRPGKAHDKFAELNSRGESFAVSAFTLAELMVGVHRSNDPAAEANRVEECLKLFNCIAFGEAAATIFGDVVGHLELKGEAIADMDALIASVALEQGELLVTRNPKHFLRVPGLIVESY
jgi:tRNA(fMet)-specific endonuclease VapC